MHAHRATLIQDIREYRHLLQKELYQLGVSREIPEDSILKWIIEEEIELVYCLFAGGHVHCAQPYAQIHSLLISSLKTSLSVLTEHYIKVPQLYNDNNTIDLALIGSDLHIRFYTSRYF